MIRSYCDACHKPKETITAVLCNSCESRRTEAMQHAAAENPNLSQSDLLYVGRQALNQVRHHSHINHVDPRNFTRSGMIPFPPDNSRQEPPR